MQLTYDAVDARGNATSDTIEAADIRDAANLLRKRGLYVTRIGEESSTRVKRTKSSVVATDREARAGLRLRTLSQFTRQMAMLLKSGAGLVPALSAIGRQLKRQRESTLTRRLIADLEDGLTLTDALRKHSGTFDSVYCAIVQAGEASAKLPDMFERLSDIVGKRRTMRKKILGALAYPALLVGMCANIILVLLFFVLPRFNDMFTQLGVEVPITTKWLLNIGVGIRSYWFLLVGMAALVAGGIVWLTRSAAGRQWACDIQLSIPVLGQLRSRLIQGQVLRTMGMLLESGVGVLETLALVRDSTRNRHFQSLFDSLEESVTSGGRLSTAFESSSLVDAYVCQAIQTGEESGNLGGAIMFCADNIDESNEELINVITRLIEPVILIGMGVVVGGVAISLFMPLFDLTSAVR